MWQMYTSIIPSLLVKKYGGKGGQLKLCKVEMQCKSVLNAYKNEYIDARVIWKSSHIDVCCNKMPPPPPFLFSKDGLSCLFGESRTAAQ